MLGMLGMVATAAMVVGMVTKRTPRVWTRSGSSVKDFWDWFAGKVGGWWDKVTGPKKGEGQQDGENAEVRAEGVTMAGR